MIITFCAPCWRVAFSLIIWIEINLEFDIVAVCTQYTLGYSVVIVTSDCNWWVKFSLEPGVVDWKRELDCLENCVGNQPDCSSCLGTMILALATEKKGPSFILRQTKKMKSLLAISKWLERLLREQERILHSRVSMFDQKQVLCQTYIWLFSSGNEIKFNDGSGIN